MEELQRGQGHLDVVITTTVTLHITTTTAIKTTVSTVTTTSTEANTLPTTKSTSITTTNIQLQLIGVVSTIREAIHYN